MTKLTIAIAGGLLAAAIAPAGAAAQSSGGMYASAPAVIRAIDCRTGCLDADTAAPGAFLRIKGLNMRAVRSVTFLGARGDADDVTVAVAQATPRSVVVKVPANAKPGRLRLRNADGNPSRPSARPLGIGSGAAPAAATGPAGEAEAAAPPVADRDTSDRIDGHVDASTVFYDGPRKATLRYVVSGDAPLEVAVEVVRTSDGASVRRWTPGAIAPAAPQRVDWDGTDAAGDVVPNGRYEFRVSPVVAVAADAGEAPIVADSFRFLDHKFPVRGTFDFGQEGAKYGAGRGGRAHQGQDVLAACGTPLVAARGGVVRWKAYHSRAGNYLVIDGDGTDMDYAYMHLEKPALVDKGDRVATGQRLGNVGTTGSSSACHLHFEMWTGPGWYEGGKPVDPLPALQSWAAQSATPAAAAALRKGR